MRGRRVVLLVALAAFGTPARAGDEAADRKALQEVAARVEPGAEANPHEAVAAYRQFFQSKPDLSPWVGVDACARIADLQHASGDTKAALEMLDWSLGHYKDHPAGIVCVNARARILLVEKRPEEVETLYRDNWERVVRAGRGNMAAAAIARCCQALDVQKKDAEVEALLRKTLLEIPPLLDESIQNAGSLPFDWIYTRLNSILIESGKEREALRFAKLRFVLCKFQQDAIERSTKALVRACNAVDPSQRTARAFSEAQADPAKPNPLAEVKLPEISPELVKARLSQLQGNWPGIVRDRVSLLIRSGDLLQAMREARRLMIDQPEIPDGALQVCRVFKAADLNLKRANDFLKFAKTGQGANPLEQFFKEQQQKPADPAATGFFRPPGARELADLVAVRPAALPQPVTVAGAAKAPEPTAAATPPAALPAPVQAAVRLALPAPVRAPAPAALPSAVAAGVAPPSDSTTPLPTRVTAPLSAPGGAAATRAAVFAQMEAGTLAPEEAWRRGELPVDTVVAFLERAGSTPLGLKLAGVLVTHYPERLDAAPGFSKAARLPLADCLSSRRDARAVPLYEGLLAQMNGKANAWVPAVYNLGQYYSSVGDHQQALDAFLRIEDYSALPQCIADCLVGAARAARALGDDDQADALYARMPECNSAWIKATAVYDRASHLIGNGKHEEARQLLGSPISGEYREEGRCLLLYLLAHSYYRTGDFPAAQRCLEEITSLRDLSQHPVISHTLQTIRGSARFYLARIQEWRASPLVCEPTDPRVSASWRAGPIRRVLSIRSLRAVPLQVTVGTPKVRAVLGDGWSRRGDGLETKVLLEIPSDQLDGSFDALVTVSAPGVDGWTTKASVRVAVGPPIKPSAEALVFGLVRPGCTTSISLSLTSSVAFRVRDVTADGSGLQILPIGEDPRRCQKIGVAFRAPDTAVGLCQGRVRITTDVGVQPVLDIPYVACVR